MSTSPISTAKARAHKDRLAALMITYPSTHGVFEANVKDVCAVIHEHGGQVYLDGANLNALVGIVPAGRARRRRQPHEPAQDLLHPAWRRRAGHGADRRQGPSGTLPARPSGDRRRVARRSLGTVSAAAFGSPSILPITWAYIAMMGAAGLTHATEVAILNANYIASRLQDHFPVVYTGRNGRVAHECIIDFRDIKQETGISVGGRRQAPGRLRLPRPDHVLAGARDDDDRADRERGQGRARPLL